MADMDYNEFENVLAAGGWESGRSNVLDISSAPNLRSDAYASGFTRPAPVSRALQNVLSF